MKSNFASLISIPKTLDWDEEESAEIFFASNIGPRD